MLLVVLPFSAYLLSLSSRYSATFLSISTKHFPVSAAIISLVARSLTSSSCFCSTFNSLLSPILAALTTLAEKSDFECSIFEFSLRQLCWKLFSSFIRVQGQTAGELPSASNDFMFFPNVCSRWLIQVFTLRLISQLLNILILGDIRRGRGNRLEIQYIFGLKFQIAIGNRSLVPSTGKYCTGEQRLQTREEGNPHNSSFHVGLDHTDSFVILAIWCHKSKRVIFNLCCPVDSLFCPLLLCISRTIKLTFHILFQEFIFGSQFLQHESKTKVNGQA